MKWVAVYAALINGQVAIVDDVDGPNEFRHYLACVGHALKATPKLQRIMRDYTLSSDLIVYWECRRIK